MRHAPSGIQVMRLYDGRGIKGTVAPSARREQLQSYRDGSALLNHIATLHGGAISDSCPACREIQQKQTAAQGARA